MSITARFSLNQLFCDPSANLHPDRLLECAEPTLSKGAALFGSGDVSSSQMGVISSNYTQRLVQAPCER